VVFILAFQFAEPGDPSADPSIAWPEQRTILAAGQIIVTSRSSSEDHWQQQVFDPTRVSAGVELSDDPILAGRGISSTSGWTCLQSHP
jgi:catalase